MSASPAAEDCHADFTSQKITYTKNSRTVAGTVKSKVYEEIDDEGRWQSKSLCL